MASKAPMVIESSSGAEAMDLVPFAATAEERILARVAANHLFLGQFEPFRASLLTLTSKNIEAAAAMLRAVVAVGGRVPGVVFSQSVPSPAHLAWMCVLELRQFDKAVHCVANIDLVKELVEMLLLLEHLQTEISAVMVEHSEHEARIGEGQQAEPHLEMLERDSTQELNEVNSRVQDAGVCKEKEAYRKASEAGFVRDIADFYLNRLEEKMSLSQSFTNKKDFGVGVEQFHDKLKAWVEFATVLQPSIMATICRNISRQKETDDEAEEDAFGSLLQKQVQIVHLNCTRDCINQGNLEKAFYHIGFLNEGYGVPETEFSEVVSWLADKCLDFDATKTGTYDKEQVTRKITSIYEGILSTGNTRLLTVLEASQDNFLHKEESEEMELLSVSPPFCRMHKQVEALRTQKILTEDALIFESMRDVFHYARVKREHVLERATSTALAAVKGLQLQIAADVLVPFPRLQPLVAVMGWDLLTGNTAARRRMMELLWLNKSKLEREMSSSHSKQLEEVSCIEHLCAQLCFNLEVAYFVADVKSGIDRKFRETRLLAYLKSKSNDMSTVSEDAAPSDAFAANLVLERLALHSPLQVIFDMVPNIKLRDAIYLVKMQPVSSSLGLLQRHRDLELLHMHYGLQIAATAVIAMASVTAEDRNNYGEASLIFLKELQEHLEAITTPARRIWMLCMTVSLLYLEESALVPTASESVLALRMEEDTEKASTNRESQPVIVFIHRILGMIRRYLPLPGFDLESKGLKGVSAKGRHGKVEPGGIEAWENERIRLRRFVEDWEWRLLVLERLLLPSEQQLSWKSALTVLQCTPSTLLNMCIQQAQFDLAREAINRFSLCPEDASLLKLAEWLHGATTETAVAAEEDLTDFIFNESLSPISSVILCVDAAATYALSFEMSKQLLDKARALLVQLSQETLQKQGGQHILPVAKRVLQRLLELLEHEQSQPLPTVLSGTALLFGSESTRQGPRQRALTMLHQTIEDAHNGKGQFLSGKLHNLVKVLADEDLDDPGMRLGYERKLHPANEHGLGLGLGFRPWSTNCTTSVSSSGSEETVHHVQKTTGKRYLGPLMNNPTAYLSAFILYVATIGDIVDGVDTTHDFNFFSLLYEQPGDLLTRLVFERGSADGAAKVAEVMGADLVHQVISACVPPVFPPRALHGGWGSIPVSSPHSKLLIGDSDGTSLSASTDDDRPVYHLDLDIIKYLATLSPVRAILACVFGDKELKKKDDFAVEQAERFLTLQRWIQMHANLQRLCDSPISSAKSNAPEEHKNIGRVNLKRPREVEIFNDDGDELNDSPNEKQIEVDESESKDATRSDTQIGGLLLDCEDEYPYQEAVEGLIKDGKLVDALAFADRWLKDGAPDKLLQLLIERGEDSVPSSSQWQGLGSHHHLWNNSWQYCIRLRDKRLAATLALKYLQRWELDAAIDVLTMCSCHLPADDVLFEEVLRVKKNLQQYGQILREDSHFRNWQEVESLCQRDPEGLALRLAGKGAVTAALVITESFKLSDDLRRELQGRQLVKLLTADPINGGGPAEALRFLGSLPRPEDALPVAMAAMEQLPVLHSKQLLVHFLLKRQIGMLSEQEHARMDRLALGLKMLGALPLPWQQRCSGLHEHPQLILETLLMWKQFQAASRLLEAFPLLRNDKVIITYAAKAISVTGPTSSDRQAHNLNKVPSHMGSGNKVNANNGNSARRGFPWSSRDTRNKIVPKDVGRKRKSTLPPSQKAAWEAMAGYQEDRPIGLSLEGYEKLAPLTMADEWVLTGDPVKDESVRGSHRYESAPSFVLFKALISLCSDQAGAAKSAVELCVSQIRSILSAENLPVDAGPEAIERAFHAAGTFVQVLLDARTELHKLLGNVEASSHTAEETGEAPKDAIGENQSLSSLTKLLSEADVWLNRVELLHFLLGSGVTASVEDVADENSAVLLRDRLIEEERYGMAVYTCTKCKIDVFPVWEAWGYALLRIEHYAQARLKFKKALQLYKDDHTKIVQKIVDTMESCPPADVSAARSLYIHMAKSVSSASDDSLSADSYLNVLYIPTFTRAERSRRSPEEATDGSLMHFPQFSADDVAGPWSNLDSTRHEECKYYLEEYSPQRLLPFMFRHGRYSEACSLFFPVGAVTPVPVALASGNSKLDPLATEYGSIDDLCDLCVGYGAIPNLEHVIAARISASGSEDAQISQHTSAALTRICTYFETHRHFNHLYRFQVLKKDYIAAGLCCIQLFLNSSTQDQVLRHLERAKLHFEEGLLARQQAIENIKLAAKASRGKSASEKLTDEELVKFSQRVIIQMEVVRCFSDTEGPPWKRSLFGNPNDNDTFKRRCEIAEALVEKNFDLAFQIIYDFGLPAVYIYAGVAAALAEKRKYNNLVELLRNIKGTIDDEDWDQIVGAAISVYANKHRERPDRLIEMLSSSHRKVLACVISGRLKSAFQIASRSGNAADVQWVAQQARMTGALPVEDMCKQWLARAS